MNKRNFCFVMLMLIVVLVTACGGKTTSAQESDKPKTVQEATETKDASVEPEKEAEQPETDNVYRIISEHDGDTEKTLLEHGKKDSEVVYQFDETIDADRAKIQEVFGKKLIIRQDASFFLLDLESSEMVLLNQGAVDSRYENGVIYFFDSENKEYSVEVNDITPKPTGNTVFSYATEPSKENTEIDFPAFYEIQEAAREGKKRTAYDNGYTILSNGDMLDHSTGNYVTNINLPAPMIGNTFNCYDTIIAIENNKMSLYYFGDSIFEILLPAGKWKVVDAYFDYQFSDEDLEKGIDSEIMRNSLTESEILLFNSEDKSLWRYHEDLDEIVSDVQDFYANGMMLYFIKDDHIPFGGSWLYSDPSEIGERVEGVSHFSDAPGFVVSDDDQRGNTNKNGITIWSF